MVLVFYYCFYKWIVAFNRVGDKADVVLELMNLIFPFFGILYWKMSWGLMIVEVFNSDESIIGMSDLFFILMVPGLFLHSISRPSPGFNVMVWLYQILDSVVQLMKVTEASKKHSLNISYFCQRYSSSDQWETEFR